MTSKEYEVEVSVIFKKIYNVEAYSEEVACEYAEDEALVDEYDAFDLDCIVEAVEVVRIG